MRALLIAVAAVSIVGCAQPIWTKAGASQDEFSRDRYSCLQDSQQRVGAASVNGLGGAAINSMQTNEMLYGTCMNSRGWYLQRPAQPFAAAQTPPPAHSGPAPNDEITASEKEMGLSFDRACADPSLQAIWAKSACRTKDITLSQRTSTRKLDDADKPAFERATKETADRQRAALTVRRRLGGVKGQQFAAIVEAGLARMDAASMDLFTGKSTWGEYSGARVENARLFQADVAKWQSP